MAAAALVAAIALSPAATHETAVAAAADIPTHQQAFAECVSQRESHGNYRARGDHSSARGRWQFLDLQWRRGLSFMVTERLVKFGMPKRDARQLRTRLQATSIDKWKPHYQDAAFIAVLNANGPWTGWRHWYLSGSRCNSLVPASHR